MNCAVNQQAIAFLQEQRQIVYSRGSLPTSKPGEQLPIWPTGITNDRGLFLRDVVIDVGARNCLEIGTGFGLSTSFILEGILNNFKEDNHTPRIITIDPFQSKAFRNAGKKFIDTCRCSSWIEFSEEPSHLYLPAAINRGESFDFVFIDGDHRFEYVFLDIFFSRRIIADRGILVVDDVWMKSVQKCIQFFEISCLLERVSKYDTLAVPHKMSVFRVISKGDARPWDSFEEF